VLPIVMSKGRRGGTPVGNDELTSSALPMQVEQRDQSYDVYVTIRWVRVKRDRGKVSY
jgi:hypothetical protein